MCLLHLKSLDNEPLRIEAEFVEHKLMPYIVRAAMSTSEVSYGTTYKAQSE